MNATTWTDAPPTISEYQFVAYTTKHLRGTSPVSHRLAHRGRLTHIRVSKLAIIGSDNGLAPRLSQAMAWRRGRQAIIWYMAERRIYASVNYPSLVQIMACRLDGAKPLLNQLWNIDNWTFGNKFQWNLIRNWYIFIQENAFEMSSWKWRPFCLGSVEDNSLQYSWHVQTIDPLHAYSINIFLKMSKYAPGYQPPPCWINYLVSWMCLKECIFYAFTSCFLTVYSHQNQRLRTPVTVKSGYIAVQNKTLWIYEYSWYIQNSSDWTH